jgi:hypothetical protein
MNFCSSSIASVQFKLTNSDSLLNRYALTHVGTGALARGPASLTLSGRASRPRRHSTMIWPGQTDCSIRFS